MDVFLLDPAGPTLRLPVLPGEISVEREKDIETVKIIDLGEVDFPTGEKVKEISFSSFFPAEYDPAYCQYADLPDPQEAMNQLTAWMMSKQPVRLIITETIINVLVLVAAHITKIKGGEAGDVYYELRLRTHRSIKVRTSAEPREPADSSGVAIEPRPDTKPVPAVYVVKSGDTLYAIAKMQLGNGSRWQEIYESNRSTIGSDANIILVGQRLVMPA